MKTIRVKSDKKNGEISKKIYRNLMNKFDKSIHTTNMTEIAIN